MQDKNLNKFTSRRLISDGYLISLLARMPFVKEVPNEQASTSAGGWTLLAWSDQLRQEAMSSRSVLGGCGPEVPISSISAAPSRAFRATMVLERSREIREPA